MGVDPANTKLTQYTHDRQRKFLNFELVFLLAFVRRVLSEVFWTDSSPRAGHAIPQAPLTDSVCGRFCARPLPAIRIDLHITRQCRKFFARMAHIARGVANATRQNAWDPHDIVGLSHRPTPYLVHLEKWSGRRDSNSRPPVPKTGALPGCATPRPFRLFNEMNRV